MAGRQPCAPALQLPARRDRPPSLLSDHAGTPFPAALPPPPAPLRLQAAPATQLQHGTAPPPPPPALAAGAALFRPPPLPLRASDTDPAGPAAHPQALPPSSGLSLGPAHLLPRCSRSPATLSSRSALPFLHTGPSAATRAGQHQPLHQQPSRDREGLSPSASLPAPGAPPAPAHSRRPAGTGGHRPTPTVHHLLPWAPSQPLAWCKGSANTAGRAKETASVYSVTHVTSPWSESALGLGGPDTPPAPGAPQQLFPQPCSSVGQGMDGWSAGSWSDGLLGRGGGPQKQGAGRGTLDERRKVAAGWTVGCSEKA